MKLSAATARDVLIFGKNLPEASDCLCQFRDIFQARVDALLRSLTPVLGMEEAYLLAAIVGEIGNNSFDHNLGQWREVTGCWLSYECQGKNVTVLLGDRGRGVLNSLQTVAPSMTTDEHALQTAFHKTMSGRHPEKRGNGLKFVARVINHGKPRGLICGSGLATLALGEKANEAKQFWQNYFQRETIPGTITLITWEATP